jgi:hypothetical protein
MKSSFLLILLLSVVACSAQWKRQWKRRWHTRSATRMHKKACRSECKELGTIETEQALDGCLSECHYRTLKEEFSSSDYSGHQPRIAALERALSSECAYRYPTVGSIPIKPKVPFCGIKPVDPSFGKDTAHKLLLQQNMDKYRKCERDKTLAEMRMDDKMEEYQAAMTQWQSANAQPLAARDRCYEQVSPRTEK